MLKVPKVNFDVVRTYSELLGLRLAVNKPGVARDLQITSAKQDTRFQMDERGVKLKSESHVTFSCDAEMPPRHRHVMSFDQPYLVLLQRVDCRTPFFALWVANAELLVHARPVSSQ